MLANHEIRRCYCDMKKNHLRAVLGVSLLAQTACVSVYAPPPASVPVASLKVELSNGPSTGFLNYVPNPGILVGLESENTILANPPHSQRQKDVSIPAGPTTHFMYHGYLGDGHCDIGFSFAAQPGGTYAIIAGDIAPKLIPGGFWANLGNALAHGFQPVGCFVRGFTVGADEKWVPMPL